MLNELRIKDIPVIDRPREKLMDKGPDSLSKSDLLAVLLGSGIRGKNVQKIARQIIQKFDKSFLELKVEDLVGIPGIGKVKALQIVSAISLVRRFYEEDKLAEVFVKTAQDVLALTHELRDRKKEQLVCLYLNARSVLLKKEVVSIGLLDKTLLHPREIFQPAVELNAASIILVHNHPSGDPTPSPKDVEIVGKIAQAGEIMGISLLDFIIVSVSGHFSFHDTLKDQNLGFDYVADGEQGTLFNLLEVERPFYEIHAEKIQETNFHIPKIRDNYFQLQNRRYIGGKQKLIDWIFSVIQKECVGNSFADIFAGTGIVSAVASKHYKKIVMNDFLYSNFAVYKGFLGRGQWDEEKVSRIIKEYNGLDREDLAENYFSRNFGGKYFSKSSAKIIGFIRQNIEENRTNLTEKEYYILLASLLYSVDKIANTVGHYDAYFKRESVQDTFFMRAIDPIEVSDVEIFRDDSNLLAKKIETDIVYIDPPYNSRQYSRFYHLLETLIKWDKPVLHGVALKPEPENMSDYCKTNAKDRFADLIDAINTKYFVVSYNNTYDSKSNSSKNKITLQDIKNILSKKGKTKVFEKAHKHFNTGKTDFKDHKEYLFVTTVDHDQKN